MSKRFLLKLCLGPLLGSSLFGCAHCYKRPAVVAAPLMTGLPPPVAPGTYLPPQGLPPSAPAPPAPGVRMYPPEWRAVPEAPRDSAAPPLAAPDAGQPRVRLLPPDAGPTPPRPPENAGTAAPPLPVGIPQFAIARDRVAAGLKPLLDGLDWLQANGYRTVLHVRAPGQDDGADRREVEKRGLKYLSIEVSPQTLTRAAVDDFSRRVADEAAQPLFVYDKDGRLAGGLWYLHFRLADKAGDDLARTKAARLGLREDGDSEQRALWLAIQKVLSEAGGS